MPRVSLFYGIAIYMYFGDHNPPHFHAIYAGDDAAVAIDGPRVIEGKLPRRAERLVIEWARQHGPELTENWRRTQAGEPLLPIDPLA